MSLPAGVVVLSGLVATALVLGGRLWFFSDDWNILADYHSGNLLEPFNGHLSLLPAGMYQVLFHTVGLGSYVPYRLCGLAALVLLGFQVLRYARTLTTTWTAVLAVTAVMWNSFGTTNVMFPFLMNFSIPVAALVAIWWHFDRDDENPSVGHLAGAGIWLAAALAASGLGVMAVAALVVELTIRRAPRRRWAALAPATLLWLLWWLRHRGANHITSDVSGAVLYALRMLWGGTTALAAGSPVGGVVVGIALVAFLGYGALRGALDARVMGALTAAGAFAALTALTRLDVTPSIAPDELRYGWTIGAYLVLALVTLWGRLDARERRADRSEEATSESGFWLQRGPQVLFTILAAVLLAGSVRLVGDMSDWAETVSAAAPGLRSNLYAAEAVGAARMGPDPVIRPLSFVPVTASSYLEAVADVGSPLQSASENQIGGRPDQRRAADELLFGSLHPSLAVDPVPASSTGQPDCASHSRAGPGDRVLVVAGFTAPGTAPPTVDVSRFSSEAAVSFKVPRAGVAYTLKLPRDAPIGTAAVIPYTVRGVNGASVCGPG